jgi:hypothetical protein
MSTNTDYLSAGQEMARRHSTEHASFAQQQEDLRHSRLVNASMSRAGINPEEAAVLRGQGSLR